MLKCLGKTLVHEFHISYSYSLMVLDSFRQCNCMCTQENSVQDGKTIAYALVTLYKLNRTSYLVHPRLELSLGHGDYFPSCPPSLHIH